MCKDSGPTEAPKGFTSPPMKTKVSREENKIQLCNGKRLWRLKILQGGERGERQEDKPDNQIRDGGRVGPSRPSILWKTLCKILSGLSWQLPQHKGMQVLQQFVLL